MNEDRVPLSVATILQLDEEYRKLAAEDKLPKIVPKERNPDGEQWLPVMYRRLNNERVVLLYSNTATAHRLGKTHDWVVLYDKMLGHGKETQCTIVTEWHEGPLKDKRVIRGRDDECLRYYEEKKAA